MLQIRKNQPTFFTDAKKKVKSSHFISLAWYELGKNEENFKTTLKEHILLEEQNMLCAYCEKEIKDQRKSNTDHFKTRHLFPKETLSYENLLVSCKTPYHCEKIKDNFGLTISDYSKIIHPVFENPNDFFEYGIDGDIFAKDGLNQEDIEKAEFTIKVFALNNSSLKRERAKIGNSLNFYHDFTYKIDDILMDINCYPSFIKNIYKKNVFTTY